MCTGGVGWGGRGRPACQGIPSVTADSPANSPRATNVELPDPVIDGKVFRSQAPAVQWGMQQGLGGDHGGQLPTTAERCVQWRGSRAHSVLGGGPATGENGPGEPLSDAADAHSPMVVRHGRGVSKCAHLQSIALPAKQIAVAKANNVLASGLSARSFSPIPEHYIKLSNCRTFPSIVPLGRRRAPPMLRLCQLPSMATSSRPRVATKLLGDGLESPKDRKVFEGVLALG